jgi:hypothetical protein
LERQRSLSHWPRQQWLAVVVVVAAVTVVAAAGCTAEEAVASTVALWAVGDSTAVAWVARFVVRKLASEALTAATILPGVAADDLLAAVIATVEA